MTALLSSRKCLITGASGGLGSQVALALAAEGVELFLTGRDDTRVASVAEQVRNQFPAAPKVRTITADLTNAIEFAGLVCEIRRLIGAIDMLVNCAGVFHNADVMDSTDEDFDSCFAMNVRIPFLLAREFIGDMRKLKWGRIVNIGSSSAYEGFAGTSVYCASKHALLGLSRALHEELKKYNIRVYCISPGSMKTKMGREVRGQTWDNFINPEEVAQVVVDTVKFDNELVTPEVRLERMVMG